MKLSLDQALKKGIESQKLGKLRQAERIYRAILKAKPQHCDANYNMGMLAISAGRFNDALSFLKIALELKPSVAQFWLSYIDTLLKLNRVADAQATLDFAREKGARGENFDNLERRLSGLKGITSEVVLGRNEGHPSHKNILDKIKLDKALKLASQRLKEGSLQEANRMYMDILERFPQNKKASEGIKTLSTYHKIKVIDDQDPPQNQLQVIINLYNQGELRRTLYEASKLLQVFPKSVTLYNILGASNKRLGNIGIAIESFKQAIRIKPDSADVYYNLASAFKEQGKLNEAIEAYQKAISLRSNYAKAYNNMGIIFKEQGELDLAIDAYKRALSIKPDYLEVFNNMGNTLVEKGMLDEAIDAYNKAISIEPDYVEAYYNMGNTLVEKGMLDEAINAYNGAISIKPNYVEAHYNRANSLLKQGILEEALKAFNEVIALKPNYSEAYFSMGETLLKQGKLEDAILAYNRAISSKPDYADAYHNIGIARIKQGKLKEAKQAFTRALSIKPNHPEAAWNLSGTAETISESKQWLKLCLESNLNHSRAKMTFGALLYYEGDKTEFSFLMKSSLKDHPFMRSFKWAFGLPKLPDLYFHRWALFDNMIKETKKSRPFYEFGVWRGAAFRYLIRTFRKGYGFDTFEGLPEDWHDQKIGAYSSGGSIPQIEGGEFIVGKFEESLPNFFAKPRPTASLINFDADLYSSTLCALKFSKSVIDAHTILIFDEFIMNNNWEQDEYKALNEFCDANNFKYEVVAISFFTKQVAVRLLGIKGID